MPYPSGQTFKSGYQSTQLPMRPTQIILHSGANAWNFNGLVGHLLNPGQPLESHYAIRFDGYRLQMVPDNLSADANYTANKRPDGTGALSIETDSDTAATDPWTLDQVKSIIELIAAKCREHGIPPVPTPSSSAPGLGFHIMWGSPGAWTPVNKSCPGAARIAQFYNVIIPGVQAVLAGQSTTTQSKAVNMKLVIPSQWEVPQKPVFVVDGIFLRWIRSAQELASMVAMLTELGLPSEVRVSNDVHQYAGLLAGDVPAGTPAGWRRIKGDLGAAA